MTGRGAGAPATAVLAAVALGVTGRAAPAAAGCLPDLANAVANLSYDGPLGGSDIAFAVGVNASGEVYVLGEETGLAGTTNWRIIKYDADLATVVASTEYNGPASNADSARAVAFDRTGNVYVAGYEAGPSSTADWRIRKYSGGLDTLLASTSYEGAAVQNDYPWAIAVDASGSVFVAGIERTAVANDWRIIKYNAALTAIVATTDYNAPANGADSAYTMAIDAKGNVLVAGVETGLSGGSNWRMRKYSAGLGLLLGSTDYNGPGNATDVAYSIAVDGTGNVFVAGTEAGATGGYNWRVRKYNASLNALVATATYAAPAGLDDVCQAVAVDPEGNVFLGGYETVGGGTINWRLLAYDNTLSTVLGTGDYDNPSSGNAFIDDATFGPDGSLYVCGYELGQGGSLDWRLRRYRCATPAPVAVPGALFPFPNPATGDSVRIGIGLTTAAARIDADLFNAAMQRVRHDTWPNVAAAPGTVTLNGVGELAPGVYLLRATATFADGSKKTFPTAKLVVKR